MKSSFSFTYCPGCGNHIPLLKQKITILIRCVLCPYKRVVKWEKLLKELNGE